MFAIFIELATLKPVGAVRLKPGRISQYRSISIVTAFRLRSLLRSNPMNAYPIYVRRLDWEAWQRETDKSCGYQLGLSNTNKVPSVARKAER